MNNEELNENIKELEKIKLAIISIKKNYVNIDNKDFKLEVKKMIDILDNIYEEVFKNSSSLKLFRMYGDHYLPTISKLLERYNNFQKKNIKSSDVKELLNNIELTIPKLNNHFESKYNSFFENSVIDLDADIKVLLKELSK